jgi:hypothetical protein
MIMKKMTLRLRKNVSLSRIFLILFLINYKTPFRRQTIRPPGMDPRKQILCPAPVSGGD